MVKHLLIHIFTLFSFAAFASTSGVTYQGRILKPDGTPLAGQFTQFKLQIRTPDSAGCLMYEEVQSQDLRNANGAFSLTINDGSGSRTDTTGLTLDKIFANHGSYALDVTTCTTGSGTYAPAPGDGRNLVVLFKDESMATWEPIPAQKINFVPFAFESKQIAGFTPEALVRVEDGGVLGNVSPLSNAQYAALLALANGTSTTYTKTGQLNGSAMPSMNSGEVLGWNGTAWVSTSPVPAAGSITSTMIQAAAVGTSQMASNVTINTSGTVGAAITTTRDFKIFAASPSTFAIDMQAPALTASYSLVWPMSAGSSGQVLTTDGSGVLSWAAPSVSTQWTTHGSNISYDGGGNVGIGTTSPTYQLNVVQATTATTGSNFQIYNDYTVAPATASSATYWAQKNQMTYTGLGTATGQMVGAEVLASRSGTGAGDLATINALVGDARNSVAGTLSNATGVYGYTKNATGTTSVATGGRFEVLNVSGTTTTGYGVYTGSIQATNKFSIYASDATAPSYFAGSVGIGTTSPGGLFTVSSAGPTVAINSTSSTAQSILAFGTTAYSQQGLIQVNGPSATSFGGANSLNMYTYSGPMTLGTNSVERLRVTNTGLVGIGTTSPMTTFHIATGNNVTTMSEVRTKSNIWSSSADGFTGTGIGQNGTTGIIQTQFSGLGYPLALNPFGGNVGIGTTSPLAKLHVNGAIQLASDGSTCAAANSGTLRYNTSNLSIEYCNGSGWLAMASGSNSYTTNASVVQNASGGITIQPAAAQGVVINSTLASTSSTTGALTVSGGVGASGAIFGGSTINAATDVTAGGKVQAATSVLSPLFSTAQGTPLAITPGAAATATSIGNAVTVTGGTAGATSGVGGNVTLTGGTGDAGTATGGAITLNGGTNTATGGSVSITAGSGSNYGGSITLQAGNGCCGQGAGSILLKAGFGGVTNKDIELWTGGVQQMTVNQYGYVGINTTAPTEKLTVVGNVLADQYLYSSDERLKKNIETIPDALAKVTSLRGVSYDWRSPASLEQRKKQIGVIAQDVEKVFPELVHESSDGVKRVNYPALIAPLIEAFKTLEARVFKIESAKVDRSEVDQLRRENEELKLRLEKMERRLDAIDQRGKSNE